MAERTINVVVAGLGGQGVLKASDILAEAVFSAGFDVKKSEIHGMSQRGGSVTSDVRFGDEVLSPMVPQGEADYLVVIASDQVEPNRHLLSPDGVLVTPDFLEGQPLPSPRSINIALLGALSAFLDQEKTARDRLTISRWENAIRSNLSPRLCGDNLKAFVIGREAGGRRLASA